jgi:hypothetical protein
VSTEEIIIGAVRIFGSLLVLRWAFVGGIVAVLVDLSDLFMMNLLHLGGVSNYQAFDKWLDQVYLACFLIVSLRWSNPARRIAVALYAWRLAGFVLFELTEARAVLVLFPNLFEFWFLFVASLPHWRPLSTRDESLVREKGGEAPKPASSFKFTQRNLALSLGVLLILKEAQELALHWFKLFDGFTAVEAVEEIWRWVTSPVR